MGQPKNLIQIHERIRTGAGARWRERTLNRAVVVLAVAAFQSVVERFTEEHLSHMEPDEADYPTRPEFFRAALKEYQVLRSRVMTAIKNYATPNADRTRALLITVGYDPRNNWTWQSGQRIYTPTLVEQEWRQWLSVRHAVAHGDEVLPDVDVISRTYATGAPTVWKADAERCIGFFNRLASTTIIGIGR